MVRTCPQCGGAGQVDLEPVPCLPRRRAGREDAPAQGRGPGRDRGRHPAADGRRGRGRACAAARRATSTSSCGSSPTSSSSATGRTCTSSRRSPRSVAALGAELEVPTLDGAEKLKVPAGAQPGDTVVLRGKGLPRLRRSGKGDLVVHLKVDGAAQAHGQAARAAPGGRGRGGRTPGRLPQGARPHRGQRLSADYLTVTCRLPAGAEEQLAQRARALAGARVSGRERRRRGRRHGVHRERRGRRAVLGVCEGLAALGAQRARHRPLRGAGLARRVPAPRGAARRSGRCSGWTPTRSAPTPPPDGRVHLVVEPRQAFGSGLARVHAARAPAARGPAGRPGGASSTSAPAPGSWRSPRARSARPGSWGSTSTSRRCASRTRPSRAQPQRLAGRALRRVDLGAARRGRVRPDPRQPDPASRSQPLLADLRALLAPGGRAGALRADGRPARRRARRSWRRCGFAVRARPRARGVGRAGVHGRGPGFGVRGPAEPAPIPPSENERHPPRAARRATIAPGEVRVPAEAAHHARVARVAPGRPGRAARPRRRRRDRHARALGGQARAGSRSTRVERERGEPPAPLVLGLAVLHTQAFDWAVEKATELGATAVVPVLAGRVQGGRHAARVERWQRLADAAVAQCGRSRAAGGRRAAATRRVPRGRPRGAAGRRARRGAAGVARGRRRRHHGARRPRGRLHRRGIGGDPGAGFVGLPLGPRILRAETAAMAALTLAQSLAGWLR